MYEFNGEQVISFHTTLFQIKSSQELFNLKSYSILICYNLSLLFQVLAS